MKALARRSPKVMTSSRTASLVAGVLMLWLVQPPAALAAALSDYFPVTPGSEWRYSAGVAQVVRRILPNTQSFHGTSAAGFHTSVNGQFVDLYWWSATSGLRVHRVDETESANPQGVRLREPLVYAPAEWTAGAVHSFSTSYAYVLSGASEPTSFPGSIQGNTRISGPESVTTPAGTFSCYRLAIEEVWVEFGEVAFAGTSTFWLAPGVGFVKASDSSGANLELQSFSIPASGPPAITSHPASQTVNAGANITLSVQATGTTPLAFQWRKDGQPIPAATQATLSLTSVSTANAGVYTVEVSNAAGRVVSHAATLTVETPQPTQRPTLTQVRKLPTGDLEVTFNAAAGKTWMFEASDDLRSWNVLPGVTATGPGTRSLGPTAGSHHRFIRLREGAPVPTDLTLPEPGKLYPGGTRLGGEIFGFEFIIPTQWKGGLRVNSPWMLFGSDTEPGLILGLLGFAGTKEQLLQDPSLRDGFETDIDANTKLFFRAIRPVSAGPNNRLSAGFSATGTDGTAYAIHLEFLIHPNGGFLGFLGLTTQAQISRLQTQLLQFVDTAKTPVRNTNVEYLNALPGRSFKWESSGNEWYSGNWQGSASSTSWSESYAFFCSDGTFEINKESTSYVSTRNSGGWSSTYMSLSYGSTTKEYGQFTVVQHPQHGNLMLIATLAGYQVTPVQFRADGSLLLGKNHLIPHERFHCQGP